MDQPAPARREPLAARVPAEPVEQRPALYVSQPVLHGTGATVIRGMNSDQRRILVTPTSTGAGNIGVNWRDPSRLDRLQRIFDDRGRRGVDRRLRQQLDWLGANFDQGSSLTRRTGRY